MGNCHTKNELEASSTISSSDFFFIKPIGRGTLGKVWKVTQKQTKSQLAIKEFTKSKIPSRNALSGILKERTFLSMLNHPFIINIQFAFQDSQKLYLGLDLKLGGDLRFHMNEHSFNEQEIKFILICVLLALEHVHSNNIIHKDVKPENIVLDSNGYAFLTDFGTSEFFKLDNCSQTCGTPGYMSPEVICRQNHSFVSDFFAIGVILYEVIHGTRPYVGSSRKEIRESILEKQVSIPISTLPPDWSSDSADFCNKLLKRRPSTRLGAKGINEIFSHGWFSDIDIKGVRNFEQKAPFLPNSEDNFDKSQVEECETLEIRERIDKKAFAEYFYCPNIKSR